MKKITTIGIIAILTLIAAGDLMAQTDQIIMRQEASTSGQRAIFATFVNWIPDTVDTAFSVSNTLRAPEGIEAGFPQGNPSGTLEFYFVHQSGNILMYETTAGSPGVGLNSMGELEPGQTYRVLMSELMTAANFSQFAVNFGLDPGSGLAGYLWIVANFEGVQGTANVTDFASFTQATVMQPDIGSATFLQDSNAGIPLEPDN
ncbi:MAG TPA: hypothetical protein VLV83_01570 [Acidobacteriota bacterium]|nr:hypothetical protein [Acidobacteriota bacterium]